MHGRVQAAVRSVCYSSVLGERPGFERASCSCSAACSCLTAEVSSVGAGSGWVFLSGERVIAPTILSRFESLRARLVVWSLALSLCREKEAGECTRGARLCCAMASARRAMGTPMRKRKGGELPMRERKGGGVVRACRALCSWGLPRRAGVIVPGG